MINENKTISVMRLFFCLWSNVVKKYRLNLFNNQVGSLYAFFYQNCLFKLIKLGPVFWF